MEHIIKSKLVSIVIPTYKSTFLKESIQSVLDQTYKNIELIIVNDNSPDDVDCIIKNFTDYRIRYYKNEVNIGGKDPVANWNKCLSLAQGEYFSLLCDDDIYEPTFIEEMLQLKAKYPYVHVFRARVKIVDANGQIIDMYPASPEFETCYDYMWHKLNWLRKQTISEFFYDTDYIKAQGGYYPLPKAWGSDDISCFILSKDNGIVTSNKLLVSFRMSDLNISANNNKNIRDKINATVCYKNKVDSLVKYCPNQALRNMILLAKDKNYEKQIGWCLFLSNLHDFIWAIKNIQINKKVILKSLFRKIFK